MKTQADKYIIGVPDPAAQGLQRDDIKLILAAMLNDLLLGRKLNEMKSRDFHLGMVAGLFMLFSSDWFPKLINDQRLCEMLENFMYETCALYMPHRANHRGNNEKH